MSAIVCEAKIGKIGDWVVARIPREASERLSSRGMVMIEGTVNNFQFQTFLEPDGKGSHWFRVSDDIIRTGKLSNGDRINLVFEQSENWTEPDLPPDFAAAMESEPLSGKTWQKVTPKAKWEWIRWIRAPKNEATRKRRIEVAIHKLKHGTTRPCCFNSATCTEPAVCRNGVLLEPE